jgi:hypothetical protein
MENTPQELDLVQQLEYQSLQDEKRIRDLEEELKSMKKEMYIIGISSLVISVFTTYLLHKMT